MLFVLHERIMYQPQPLFPLDLSLQRIVWLCRQVEGTQVRPHDALGLLHELPTEIRRLSTMQVSAEGRGASRLHSKLSLLHFNRKPLEIGQGWQIMAEGGNRQSYSYLNFVAIAMLQLCPLFSCDFCWTKYFLLTLFRIGESLSRRDSQQQECNLASQCLSLEWVVLNSAINNDRVIHLR